ncbi:MAG: Rieske 2Fe-2S domain-containing protein [Actinomycetota bacterium]|nr:Rieske 2Fe-2S domain-containing protein [Actinomycetota bacterium]
MTPASLTEDWTRVAHVSDVPLLEGRRASVDGRPIALFRLPGGWAATDAACPHRGGPLADGLLTGRCVACPLHGSRFDLQTGAQIGGADSIAIHEIRERDGELWVRIALAT